MIDSSQVQLKALLFCQKPDKSVSVQLEIIKGDPPCKLCKMSGLGGRIFPHLCPTMYLFAFKRKIGGLD